MKPIIGILLIILIFVGLFYFYSVFAADRTANTSLKPSEEQGLFALVVK